MNTQKIMNRQERAQGLISNIDFDFANQQCLEIQEHLNPQKFNYTSVVSSCSSSSSFHTTESYNGFQETNDSDLGAIVRSCNVTDHKVISTNSYSCPTRELDFSSPPPNKKSSSRFSSGNNFSSSSKTRIRWTQDLHDRFILCVAKLGGADKATPKAILKLMGYDGLTIFHVKSHLQKYRMVKYSPDCIEGKSETRGTIQDKYTADTKTGVQLKEALQLQLDVQMQLHEQLEIQRNLQVRIEEQGRKLKIMLDEQEKANECGSSRNYKESEIWSAES